jgi:hypothetical protein
MKRISFIAVLCCATFGYSEEATLPAGLPQLHEWGQVIAEAEFLYWKAQENNLAYVITNFAESDPCLCQGRVYYPKFQYDPGFRAKAAFAFGDRDNFALSISYLWFKTKTKAKTITDLCDCGRALLWIHPDESDFMLPEISSATCCPWKKQLNVVDFIISRESFISPNLQSTWGMGIECTWQHESFSVQYIKCDDSSRLTSCFTQKTRGIGTKAIANFIFSATSYLGFYLDSSLTLMYAEPKRTEKFMNDEMMEGNVAMRMTGIYPVFNTNIGIQASWIDCSRDFALRIKLGWEEYLWSNLSHINSGPFPSTRDDLTYEGLTLGITLDF